VDDVMEHRNKQIELSIVEKTASRVPHPIKGTESSTFVSEKSTEGMLRRRA
jgi:hypothetical protein